MALRGVWEEVMNMTKRVWFSDEAYRILLNRRRGRESISQVIMRELGTKTKPDIMQFAGMWHGKKWDGTKEEIYKQRHAAKMREFQ